MLHFLRRSEVLLTVAVRNLNVLKSFIVINSGVFSIFVVVFPHNENSFPVFIYI